MKINPFNPNSPVNPGMFMGRIDEIESLEQALVQAKAAAPAHFMVTGERGIGKSSLLQYIQLLADGEIPYNDETFNFLVINLDIDAKTTQLGLVERTAFHLENSLGKTEPARKFMSDAWSFVQRIRVKGTGIDPRRQDSQPEELLLDQFATSMAKTVSRITDGDATVFSAKYDGILVLIDEVDNASPELSIGSFLKLFLERLQRQGCSRVLIGLAGLPEVRARLIQSHPSSVRVFHELPLGRLSDAEVASVIDVCIDKANSNNKEPTRISDDAKSLLVSLSEGFPHFIQQFGFSAFSFDSDDTIDIADVNRSAFGSRGALEIIGDRYYRHDFYIKIQEDKYRQVLQIMADDLDGWVPRTKIQARFKGKAATLNNAIKALRDRHIILSKEGAKGVYRLQHKGFALWIKLHANRNAGTGEPSSRSRSISTG